MVLQNDSVSPLADHWHFGVEQNSARRSFSATFNTGLASIDFAPVVRDKDSRRPDWW